MDFELEVWDEAEANAKKEQLKERDKQTHLAAQELMELKAKGFNIYSDELLKFLEPYYDKCYYTEEEKKRENLQQFKQRVFKQMTTGAGEERKRIGHVDPLTKMLVDPEETTDIEALQRCYNSLYKRAKSLLKEGGRYATRLTELGHSELVKQVTLDFNETEQEVQQNVR